MPAWPQTVTARLTNQGGFGVGPSLVKSLILRGALKLDHSTGAGHCLSTSSGRHLFYCTYFVFVPPDRFQPANGAGRQARRVRSQQRRQGLRKVAAGDALQIKPGQKRLDRLGAPEIRPVTVLELLCIPTHQTCPRHHRRQYRRPYRQKLASSSTPGYAAFILHHQDSAIARDRLGTVLKRKLVPLMSLRRQVS